MKLPFSFGKKDKKEYFLAVLMWDEKVSAVIFEEASGKMHAIGQTHEYFPDSIENINEDEFLDALDKAISKTEEKLSIKIDTYKTIFGVKENWVEDSKLKKDYLGRLKKACDLLSLVPIGFLVIHEAVAHLMAENEGAPVSAVLVEVGKKTIAISLLRAGRIAETKRSEIEDSVAKSTDKLLHHFTSYEVLPSRIVIVGDIIDVEKLSQEFVTHSWGKTLPFLHVPQVTIQPLGFEAKAVLSGVASQMGFELLHPEVKEKTPGKQTEENNFEETEDTEKIEDFNNQNFGFMQDSDVGLSKKIKKESAIEIEEKEEEEIDEELGVPPPPEDLILMEKRVESSKKSAIISLKNSLKIFSALPLLSLSMFKILKGSPDSKIKLVFVAVILFTILAAISFFYIFSLKANITLVVTPKVIDENQDIIFSSKDPTDSANKIVAMQSVSVNEDGSISENATGTKEVGTPAKGTVTLYSRLTDDKTLPAGTIIESSNNLLFTFDKSVDIASSSADASSAPVTTDVSVTAKSLGKESNLPSGTKFSVDGIDTALIVAKNNSPFSGGTKQDITVVSKADQQKAMDDLAKNLSDKAKADLGKNISTDTGLIEISLNPSFTKKNFNNNVGDQASSTKLDATISYSAFSYAKADVNQIFKTVLNEKSKDMTFSDKDISYEITSAKQKSDNEIVSSVHVTTPLLPKIDNAQLAKDNAGKSLSNVKRSLSNIPEVSDVRISISPSIFSFLQMLPRMANNINITITTE